MEERYEIIKGIGSGNFGVAKLVRERQSGKLYAVKIIERGLKVCALVFNFISLLIYACCLCLRPIKYVTSYFGWSYVDWLVTSCD